MITAQEMIQREVHYCVSSLVSTLASGYGSIENSARSRERGREGLADLAELCEQAAELCYPIDDFEEAAIQEGWKASDIEGYFTSPDGDQILYDDWQELCSNEQIEPYQREIFEHWIVSDWLADKLEAKGERVARDIGGMTIWGRTTTGQAIYMDSVIADIHAEMTAA